MSLEIALGEKVVINNWISTANGGCGAVRDACEFILTARGEWPSLVSEFK